MAKGDHMAKRTVKRTKRTAKPAKRTAKRTRATAKGTKRSVKRTRSTTKRTRRAAPRARRTTHRSASGKKLYAVRDKKGRFKDIQTYKRAHAADIRRKSKAEKSKQRKKR
jgi:hypothetical protein